jgi:lipid II:glycine glycyltransferase (peptidoglycan interpeptide bridge formation enzyme)
MTSARSDKHLGAVSPGGGKHGPSTVALVMSEELKDERWDAFLDSVPGAHFEQLSGWGAVKARYGWHVFRIIAMQAGQPVGGVQVLTRRLGKIGVIGYVARGPAVGPGQAGLDELLVEEVNRIARRESWIYCVHDYPYQGQALASFMAGKGYGPHPDGIPPSGLMQATSLVDLSGTEEAILARMNRNTRRNIRTAEKSDLVFSLGTAADLPRFRELMVETCTRRNAAPTPPQKDYFLNLWDELGQSGRVRLFVVRSGPHIISGLFAFAFSDTLRLWKSGWSGSDAEKSPSHLMFWEAIRWAKARGFRKLDLVWMDPEDAKRVARGEPERENFRTGITHFKLGFGGEILFCPAAQSRMFHPVLHFVFRAGGARLLASAPVRRLLTRVWSRARGE